MGTKQKCDAPMPAMKLTPKRDSSTLFVMQALGPAFKVVVGETTNADTFKTIKHLGNLAQNGARTNM